MKFCIGDLVKGNNEADRRYGITTSGCIGEVVGICVENGVEYITLKVVSHEIYPSEIGHKFDVLAGCFDLVDTYVWNGIFRTANNRRLFSVENGVPVVENVSKDSPCYKQLCAEYDEYVKNKKEKNHAVS